LPTRFADPPAGFDARVAELEGTPRALERNDGIVRRAARDLDVNAVRRRSA
jgi:hypothetical protein